MRCEEIPDQISRVNVFRRDERWHVRPGPTVSLAVDRVQRHVRVITAIPIKIPIHRKRLFDIQIFKAHALKKV